MLLAPPGGAGYGDPFQRPVDAVLADVVSGYVSLEALSATTGLSSDTWERPTSFAAVRALRGG